MAGEYSDEITHLNRQVNHERFENRQLKDDLATARRELYRAKEDSVASESALRRLRQEHSESREMYAGLQRACDEMMARTTALEQRNISLEVGTGTKLHRVLANHVTALRNAAGRTTKVESQLSQLVLSVNTLVEVISQPSERLIQRMTELRNDAIQPAQASSTADQKSPTVALDLYHLNSSSYHILPALVKEDFINAADSTRPLPTAVPSRTAPAPAPKPRGRPSKRTLEVAIKSLPPADGDDNNDDEDDEEGPAVVEPPAKRVCRGRPKKVVTAKK